MSQRNLQHQITNTVNEYKAKCNKLEDDINVLKSAIYQLSQLPNGIHLDIDKKMQALQTNLKENRDSKKIKKSVELLVCAMSDFQKKNQTGVSQQLVNNHINVRLTQLLKQLHIPKDISLKLNSLKTQLKQRLTTSSLAKVVDSLTDLVIKAFNLEHSQFKNFLKNFSDYLHDFGHYIELSNDNNRDCKERINNLQQQVGSTIQSIKTHLNEGKISEEWVDLVSDNLNCINQQIIDYSNEEQQRINQYNEKLMELHDTFLKAECGAEKMRNQLSSHTVNTNQDSLTEIANKIAYDDYLLGAYHRWERGFGDTSLALGEIDDLSEINAKFGYQTGDKVLKKIGKLFKNSIRAVDFVARYDGDAFAFIFERTPAHSCIKVLENLRVAVEECEIYSNGDRVNVSISFGLTAFQHGDTIESSFLRANKAMDKAKRTGRNRVIALV